MFAQYFGIKERYADAIVLMRVGDFYEAYGDDAETIARRLHIALTSKEAGSGKRLAMAGVPHHALDVYLAKLVAQQCVVAIADQLEAPIPNKLTRRDVTRLVTPGTLIEEHLLERSSNNYLTALTQEGEALGIASADISTGRAIVTAYSGEGSLDEMLGELSRLGPAEIVADAAENIRRAVIAQMPALRVTAPHICAVQTRDRAIVTGFSLDESLAMHRALDALGNFVRRAGITADELLRAPDFYRSRAFLSLDANTRKHLDIVRTSGSNAKATLLATVDRCKTAMGSRMLSRMLSAPLVDRVAIASRADRVQTLVGDYAARAGLQEVLDGTFDLERIAQKARFRRATPRDLGSLRRTLALLPPLREALPPALASLGACIADLSDMLALLEKTLVDEPPISVAEGGVIRPQANPELQECASVRGNARDRIAALEERERRRTGIKTLKVKYASAFGYAIEISKSNLAMVPSDYVRKQTLTGAERFITQELKELEIAISDAQSRQLRLEEALYANLLESVAQRVEELLVAADAVAELDVYCSLAQVAGERGYVRPRFSDDGGMHIVDGRHPVMEQLAGAAFVPNDLHLEETSSRFILLTGPNMGGKSTFLRQAALLTILAQIGSFVPARSMTSGVVESIFTRIGAGDDLASGQSTFYVEMAEMSNILRRCTRRSLLLIDEVGRGTGTLDGLAIAQAVCEYLLCLEGQAPMTLFATHFHELVALAEDWPLAANFHVTALDTACKSGAPVFSHRVLPGSTSRSFGIEVARMAGLPAGVVARAREIAERLSGKPVADAQAPLRARLAAPNRHEEMQLPLGL